MSAHRLEIAAGPPGKFRSLHALHHGVIAHRKSPLDPVVTTEPTLRRNEDFGKEERPAKPAPGSGMVDTAPPADLAVSERVGVRRQRLAAAGGILAALGAASCCVVPFALFTLGVSGAWIGNLTALEPYQPAFAAIAVACLGYGFYLLYRRPKVACAEGS
jgi:mercuric ion transport protein